jgi:hypothetical protein
MYNFIMPLGSVLVYEVGIEVLPVVSLRSGLSLCVLSRRKGSKRQPPYNPTQISFV